MIFLCFFGSMTILLPFTSNGISHWFASTNSCLNRIGTSFIIAQNAFAAQTLSLCLLFPFFMLAGTL